MSKALIDKKKREDISKKILNLFKKKGFNFIDLDIVIDTDLLTQRSGEAFKKYALNFKDKSGKDKCLAGVKGCLVIYFNTFILTVAVSKAVF